MADTTTEAPATHSQPSRKGKKAWRKNVDLSEVEHGLDTLRHEIIHGGVVAEKPSDELFITDTTGDAGIAKQQRSKKLLKADEILAQRSSVPGLDGRKRKAADDDAHLPSASGKKPRNGTYVSHKALQRLRRLADNADGGGQLDDAAPATHDPWAVQQQTPPQPSTSSSSSATAPPRQLDFLDPPKPTRAPKTLKQAPAPLTLSGRAVAHVRKPDAGKSYNPSADAWAALLEREGAAAVEAELARLAEDAADEAKSARAAAEAAKVEAAERAAEASGGESAWESEWDGIQSEAEQQDADLSAPTKPARRKTQADRNRAKARKAAAAAEAAARSDRVRAQQERRIGEIAADVSAADEARKAAALAARARVYESSDSDEDAAGPVQLQRRRFGKLHVPEAPLEVTLPEDLQDSLRRLKPEGNLLADRYRNLLINGKLEVRKRAPQHRQRKTYRTEKWSYKDWTLK